MRGVGRAISFSRDHHIVTMLMRPHCSGGSSGYSSGYVQHMSVGGSGFKLAGTPEFVHRIYDLVMIYSRQGTAQRGYHYVYTNRYGSGIPITVHTSDIRSYRTRVA